MGTNAGGLALGTHANGFAMGTNGVGHPFFSTNRNGLVSFTNRAGHMVIVGTNPAVGGVFGRQGTIVGMGVGGGTNSP
jgi:hypothetical protein